MATLRALLEECWDLMEGTAVGYAGYNLDKYRQALKDHKKSGAKLSPKHQQLLHHVLKASKWVRHKTGRAKRSYKQRKAVNIRAKDSGRARLQRERLHDKVARMAQSAEHAFRRHGHEHLATAMVHLRSHHLTHGTAHSPTGHWHYGYGHGSFSHAGDD